ncbi:hypothetical protein J2T57_001423 [Natronocella acetinitrilica]|uniref:Uncharacterized protein n=1 Tax=Natronocella acetinitrilica TaxID=414046 RepID=A0AAE3G3Y9_9GAMM|nr:hypothetical protein [Natronocella acetinitrilica]MCP1674321.1 hypothetical protein [Natronocella acetinitrilica]
MANEGTALEGVTSSAGALVVMRVPWFTADEHKAFQEWVSGRVGHGLASWIPAGYRCTQTEFPDIFVGVDPGLSGEGTDAEMPEHYWSAVVEAARAHGQGHNGHHIIVWIGPAE